MLLEDLRYAVRTLRQRPGFTLPAVLTLALATGAVTVGFGVVSALLLGPLAARDPGRLAAVFEHHPARGVERNEVSPANFLDWRRESRCFERLVAFAWWNPTLTGVRPPEALTGALVSADYFATLGLRPALGRDLQALDERPDAERVVLISDGLWKRRFGAESAILGSTLRLADNACTVIGVMPAGAVHPMGADVWVPLRLNPEEAAQRGSRYLNVFGRLKPGTTLARARAEMQTLAAALARRHPESNEGWGAILFPLTEHITRYYAAGTTAIFAAAGFVLLIACANVANLMLVRASGRTREIAVRLALGASRRRIVGQLLVESLVVALAGGAAGTLLAMWGVDVVRAALPADYTRFIPGWDRMGLDGRVLLFALATSALAALLFGLAPALHGSRPDVQAALKEGAPSLAGGGRQRLRRLLVVAEVALALPLLAGAGVAVQSLVRILRVDPGFEPERVLCLRATLPAARYPDPAQTVAYFDRAVDRLTSLPGVEGAAAISHVPLGGSSRQGQFDVADQPAARTQDQPEAYFRTVTPGCFRALGVPLLDGRDFDDRDRAGAPDVAIVNRELARRHFGGRSPLGRALRIGERRYQIVGVAGDVRYRSLFEDPFPTIYRPLRQNPSLFMCLLVRGAGPPGALAPAARGALHALYPDQPVTSVAALDRILGMTQLVGPRFLAGFLGVFAAIALALAAVGIFGVMSYAVSRRTHEIGVRMALGARGGQVVGMVVGDGLRLTLAGLALGTAGSLLVTRALADMLFEVKPGDPATLLGVSAVLGGVAALASWLPARRAARVDPVVALRCE